MKPYIIQAISAILALYFHMKTVDFFQKDIHILIQGLIRFFVSYFMLVLIATILNNICLSIVKYIYAKIKHIKLQCVNIFPFMIFLHPLSIKLGVLGDVMLLDLTYLSYTCTNTDTQLLDNFKKDMLFQKSVTKYHFLTMFFIVCLFFIFKNYVMVSLLIGVTISNYYHKKVMKLRNGIPLGICNYLLEDINNENLLYTALKYACIEQFDKTKLYEEVFKLKISTNTEYMLYCFILIEAIVDSIIDHKQYVDPNSYIQYLSGQEFHKEVQDTTNILRYFYFYHKVLGNEDICDKLRTDIFYQMYHVTPDTFLYAFISKEHNRWIKEFQDNKYDLLKDEKYNMARNIDIFKQKRRCIEKLLNIHIDTRFH